MVDRLGLDPEVAIVSKKTGIGRSAHLFLDDEIRRFEFSVEASDFANREFDEDGYDADGNHEDDYLGESLIGSEIERDGAAVEVRSVVHSACRDNIIPYVAEALRQTHLDLEKWNNRFKLSSTPKYVLDAVSLKEPPADVVEFGCRPDMDAYTLQPKDPTCAPDDKRRWTGGHIHASTMGARQNVEQQAALAIMFDYCVALPMVAMLGHPYSEGEAERRKLYGQPGSFRYDDSKDKIEFRTLSGRLLLSPILLGWALGMVKGMVRNVKMKVGSPRYYMNYKEFLLEYLTPVVSAAEVYDVIMNHNVEVAEELMGRILQALPNYKVDEKALANPLGGGGGGTLNPYFYEKSAEVLIEANKQGMFFPDDMQLNWGFYKDYEPKHHAYWGVQTAFVGLCDDTIFPMRPLLDKMWPSNLVQQVPIYTHPLNGGNKQFVTPGAAHWLQ